MLPLGSHPAWHPVFETAAYAGGYALYRYQRSRRGDILTEPQRWNIIAAAAIGALAGSRLLGLAEQWPTVREALRAGHLLQLLLASGGKTIVGGLLGAWLAVELLKRATGIRQRTGDLFVFPLCLGIFIGRVGCLIAGLADDTYGLPTRLPLPWIVDLGDGIPRQPVQLYEILFLAALALVFHLTRRRPLPNGIRFRIFLASYLAWRLFIDFFKPQPLFAGLNLIQWACAAGLLFLLISQARSPKENHEILRA